jgi:hypothetical protein
METEACNLAPCRMRPREVAQFGSALRSGRRGRGFKSPLPDCSPQSDTDSAFSNNLGQCHAHPRAQHLHQRKHSGDRCLNRGLKRSATE